jgi:hypothetical protein
MQLDFYSLESRYGFIAAVAILDEIRKAEEQRVAYFAPRMRDDTPADHGASALFPA